MKIEYFRILILTSLFFIYSCSSLNTSRDSVDKNSDNTENKSMILLENKNAQLAVSLFCGGRIVRYRKPGGKNILNTNFKLLRKNSIGERPEISAEKPIFKGYRGHVFWLGPQSDWWKQQTVNEVKRKYSSIWPPDPYIVEGDYSVVEQKGNYLKIISPESPISGVTLEKEITLNADGSVNIKATIKNITENEVSWDIWSNTRLSGYAVAYVPIVFEPERKTSLIDFKAKVWDPDKKRLLQYKMYENYMYFDIADALNNRELISSNKAYIASPAGEIYVFTDSILFVKKFLNPDFKGIHKAQAAVEIFQQVESTEEKSLLEAEMHSPYKTLKPGEKLSFEEKWHLIPYNGPANTESHIKFIKKQN